MNITQIAVRQQLDAVLIRIGTTFVYTYSQAIADKNGG